MQVALLLQSLMNLARGRAVLTGSATHTSTQLAPSPVPPQLTRSSLDALALQLDLHSRPSRTSGSRKASGAASNGGVAAVAAAATGHSLGLSTAANGCTGDNQQLLSATAEMGGGHSPQRAKSH